MQKPFQTTEDAARDLLLADFPKCLVKRDPHLFLSEGCAPTVRPLQKHLERAFVHIDKPRGPSSHEVSAWLKRVLAVSKAGHLGTLDPNVSGSLLVLLGKATRLAAQLSRRKKEYVCVAASSFFREPTNEATVRTALHALCGKLFQRPPERAAVARRLRVREVFAIDVVEFSAEKGLLLFRVACEAGTYIRTLCFHLGLALGVPVTMKELRRTHSGSFCEDSCSSLFAVLDAVSEAPQAECYLRKIVRPLEELLTSYKKMYVDDGAVDALANGAPLSLRGLVRYSSSIERGDIVVLVTSKGEAVALAEAIQPASFFLENDYGYIAKPKMIFFEKGEYPKLWKPQSNTTLSK